MSKIKITESQYKRLINEGIFSTIKGIKGYLGGTGYAYTKYSNEVIGLLEDANQCLNEIYPRLQEIVELARESTMSDEAFVQIDNNVSDTLEAYKMLFESNEISIDNLSKSLANNREFIRDMGHKPKFKK